MSAKEQSSRKDEANSKPSSPQPATQSSDMVAKERNHPATIIQRAILNPDSLRPHDVLQLQRTLGNRAVVQLLAQMTRHQPIQKAKNRTGLPDDLKSGIENLSGYSMDDVKVYYNSDKPSQLQAHSYAQGTDIHIAPGQEKHLSHEAWHVVQQKQGRVKPTMQMEGGVNVNDDAGLEREADVMSAKAQQIPHRDQDATNSTPLQRRKRDAFPFTGPSEQSSPLPTTARIGLVGPAAKVQSAASQLITTSVIHGGSKAPVQRVIDPGKDEYAKDKRRVKGPAGTGIIIEVKGIGYKVQYDTGNIDYVPAKQLDLVEATEEEPKSSGESLPEKKEAADLNPTKLIIEKGDKLIIKKESGNNKWSLELKNADGTTLATKENVGQGVASQYLEISKQRPSKIKAGTFDLNEGAELKGVLKTAYDKFMKARQQEAVFAEYAAAWANEEENEREAISQEDVFKRLQALHKLSKYEKGTGHPSIRMTKIALDNPVKLKVGGQERNITHLYTQGANDDKEIRCYLGNKRGAYQRVHVSLTQGDVKTAHTMVQTSGKVGIPGYREGGKRIGFDTKEGEVKGFAGRELMSRSDKQTKVETKGVVWLEAEAYKDLAEDMQKGTVLLAKRIHSALDAVIDDIRKREPEKRKVEGITPDFKILDDEWLFENKGAATPLAEYKDSLYSDLYRRIKQDIPAYTRLVEEMPSGRNKQEAEEYLDIALGLFKRSTQEAYEKAQSLLSMAYKYFDKAHDKVIEERMDRERAYRYGNYSQIYGDN